MTSLAWLHLSDWHQKGRDFDRKVVRDALLRDIRERRAIDPRLGEVAFVVFSGDLAHGGKAEEYTAAREGLLDPVVKEVGVDRGRVVIVPGNHDLDRAALELLPGALQKPLASSDDVHKWLTDDRRRSLALQPFEAFRGFVAAYTGHEAPDYANLVRFDAGGRTIAILGLNSAWMCGRHVTTGGEVDDYGSLVLGEPQVHDALDAMSDADIRIVALHHPWEWLAEWDRERVEDRIHRAAHFVLSGHVHRPKVKVALGTGGDSVEVPAGASYDRRVAGNPRYTNAYNWVHLDFESGRGTAFLRRWSEARGAWIEDTDAHEGGRYSFALPKDLSATQRAAPAPVSPEARIQAEGIIAGVSAPPTPSILVYVSAAPEDLAYVDRLEKHLATPIRLGRISLWHEGLIRPGDERHVESRARLDEALVFVPLLSAEYLASNDLHELSGAALAREQLGQLVVAPIVVRACHWDGSAFGKAHPLLGGETIGTPTNDAALRRVALELDVIIARLEERPPVPVVTRQREAAAERDDFKNGQLLSVAVELAVLEGVNLVDVHHILGALYFDAGIAHTVLEEQGISWSLLRDLAGVSSWPPSPSPSALRTRGRPQPRGRTAAADTLLAVARQMRERSRDSMSRSRDLLAAALTLRDVPVVEALLAHGILGERVAEVGGTRIFAKLADQPWRLPVEAFTIPSGSGNAPSGGLWKALRAAITQDVLDKVVHAAMREGISPSRPVLAMLPLDLRSDIVPSIAFVATSASQIDGCADATDAILQRASAEGIESLAIALLGSGQGGLDSGDVAETMVKAVLRKAGGVGPANVVLTTLVEGSVRRAVRAGEGSRPFDGGRPRSGPDARSSLESALPPARMVGPEAIAAPAVARFGEQLTTRVSPPQPAAPGQTQVATVRLEIKGGKVTLSPTPSGAWSREGLPAWADLAIDTGDGSVPLEEALPKLDQWSLEQTIAFGEQLAAVLFGGSVPDDVRRALAVPVGTTLRLMLDLDSDAAIVPWEYLRIDGWFLIEQRVSMIRHIAATMQARPLRLAQVPRAMLFAWASPLDDDEDFVGEGHVEDTEAALKETFEDVRNVSRCSPSVLRRELRSGVEAIHYLGHGEIRLGNAGHLIVHGERGSDGRTAEVDAQQLATWIGNTNAKLVFLGACHSAAVPPRGQIASLAGEIARRTGIPVVAMQVAVPRPFATAFAREFYRHLRVARDIELAVYLARQVEHDGRHAFGIPVLYADERAADAPCELPPPPTAGWPRFAVMQIQSEPPERARDVWGDVDLPDEARALVDKAVEEMAAAGRKSIPVPRADTDAAVRDAIRDLIRSKKGYDAGDLAKALDAHRAAAAPAPIVLAGVRGAIEVRADRSLSPRFSELTPKLDAIASRFALAQELLLRVVSELAAGRHVLFVGPVGTGKTTLAIEICRALGYEPFTVTASADWTAFDVVGGFFPQTVEKDGVARTQMAFRPVGFTEAVLKNWREAPSSSDHVAFARGSQSFWLVLDEMNRADVDRALGPVFTALETRRLRVPTASFAPGEPATIEIPVPKDFRVLATLNGVDRHYLFRLSDALKRRFAFIEVPMTWDLAHEWTTIKPRCDGPLPVDGPAGDVRRFVYLARAFYPIGTAQLLAATKFLAVSAHSGLDEEARLTQAIRGSVLPSLEDAPAPLLRLLEAWARRDAGELADVLETMVAAPAATAAPVDESALDELRSALAEINDGLIASGAPEASPIRELARKLARRSKPLALLGRTLAEMGRANESYHVGA